jgi:hypothetical protein
LALRRPAALRIARRINSQDSLVRSATETPDMEGFSPLAYWRRKRAKHGLV